MIITQIVKCKDNKSFKRLESLGYIRDTNDSFFNISPFDLSESSHYKVDIKCDSAKSTKCLGTFSREWGDVVKQRSRIGNKDYCKFCQKTEEFSGRDNPNTKYFFEDSLLDNIDTPEKAYLLGWIASDGYISNTGSITISIRDYDVDVLLKLRAIIDSNLPIKEHRENMVSLTINSTHMANSCLKHLGLDTAGKKDSNVKYPKLNDNTLHQYFIRGYFEGDGSISLHSGTPRCSISSNSENMLYSIKEHSNYGSVYLSNTGNQWQINSGRVSLDFLSTFLYKDNLHLSLNRKYDRYVKYSEWVPSLSGSGTYTKLNSKYGIIKFNKSNPKAILPNITDTNASGIDLHIIEKVKDFTDSVSLYTTGIKVQPPEGYYFILVGRSSISKSGYSLANSIGIIDQNYIGEILVPLRNNDNLPLELPSKMVQLVLMPKLDFDIVEVDSFESTERGEGGFGSTDHKSTGMASSNTTSY